MECNNHPNLGNACTVFSYTQNQQQQKSNSYCLNPSCFAGLSEPLAMTRMKSSVRTKGTRSLLMPNFFFLWSRKCPKSMWKTWRGERTLQFHNGGGWFSTQCKRPEEERELFSFTMVVADSRLSMKDLKRRENSSVSQWWWLILDSVWKTWRGERTLQFHNGGGWFSTQCERPEGERKQFHNGGGWCSTQSERPEEEKEHFIFTTVVADSQLNVKDLKRREDTSVSQWWWLILNSMWKTWRGERTLQFHNGGSWSVQMKGERERCRDTDRDRDRELFCFPHNTLRSSEWRENHVFQMSALTTGWLLQPLITHPPQWPQGDHHRHW